MFFTQISEGGILSIYDKTKMMCRTWIEAINNLFSMGKELEESVDGLKGGIVKDVTLTEVDKHYTLTILYDDNTSDTVTWDDSTVGIEDITLNYSDGVYILAIELTDGTRYTFSIPVGDIVTQQELTALNLGTPDDTASSTGSLWARVKDAVARITTNEGNITSLQTNKADKIDTYTKAEVNTALASKANTVDVYNKTEINAMLDNKYGATAQTKSIASATIETYDLFTADSDGIYLFSMTINGTAKQSTIAIGYATNTIGQTFIESSTYSNESADDQRCNATIIVQLLNGQQFAPNIFYRNESTDTNYDSVNVTLYKQVVKIV